jgi:hypothetical protein
MQVLKTVSEAPAQIPSLTGPGKKLVGVEGDEQEDNNKDEHELPHVDEDEDPSMPLSQLRRNANIVKLQLKYVEWQMKYVEWMLGGVAMGPSLSDSQAMDATNGTGGGVTTTGAPIDSSQMGMGSSNSAVAASAVTASGLTGAQRTNQKSFFSWLTDATSAMRQSNGDALSLSVRITTRLQELLKEHSHLSAAFLAAVVRVRARERKECVPVQPQNVALTVMISKVCFNLLSREKTFLCIYVEGIAASAHAFDDLSADFALEVASFGARNTMQAYTVPGSKEAAWAELVMPMTLPAGAVGVDAAEVDQASSVNACSASTQASDTLFGSTPAHFHGDNMIALHGVKREEPPVPSLASSPTGSGGGPVVPNTLVIQHLELNIHPLRVQLTYDTLSALQEFFVTDQQKFNTHLPVSSVGAAGGSNGAEGGSAIDTATLKSKMKFAKLKSKFLPTGHILEHASKPSTSPAAAAAASSSSKDEKDKKHKGGLLSALKHSRVAKMLHISDKDKDKDGDEHEPPSPSPLFGMRARSATSGEDPFGCSAPQLLSPTGVALLDKNNMGLAAGSSSSLLLMEGPSPRLGETPVRKMSASSSSSSSSAAAAVKAAAVGKKKKSNAPLLSIVYVRMGSTLVNVSFWGNRGGAGGVAGGGGGGGGGIEDFQGLNIKLKQVVLQKKRWTAEKFANHLKKELLRNLLGQVSNTLGSFLSYKLGFRPAQSNEAISQALVQHDEHRQQRLDKIMAAEAAAASAHKPQRRRSEGSDDEDGGKHGGGGVPDASSLLAQLEDSASEDESSSAEQVAVKSMLFGEGAGGAKKSAGAKFKESLASILPRSSATPTATRTTAHSSNSTHTTPVGSPAPHHRAPSHLPSSARSVESSGRRLGSMEESRSSMSFASAGGQLRSQSPSAPPSPAPMLAPAPPMRPTATIALPAAALAPVPSPATAQRSVTLAVPPPIPMRPTAAPRPPQQSAP